MKRLNPNADLYNDDIFQYFKTRALQAKPYGYKLEGVITMDCIDLENNINFKYIVARFTKNNNNYASFYMPADNRGKGNSDAYAKEIKLILQSIDGQVITFNDCKFAGWLQKNNIPYVLLENTYIDTAEYLIMSKVYGDEKASRSGLYLMNHIDEGADIMIQRNASEDAIKAFIAHPMLQDDEHFMDKKELLLNNVMAHCSKYTLLLCMEYRKVANAYLCKPETDNWTQEQIKFHCPILLSDVREMLVADKVQNYKDFLQYHALTHPRRNELFAYFNNWITYLNCADFANKWIAEQEVKIKLHIGYKK